MIPIENRNRWYVTYQTSYTQSQIAPPTPCKDKAEAESLAREYNRTNQDQSWNAVNAYPAVVKVGPEGYAI